MLYINKRKYVRLRMCIERRRKEKKEDIAVFSSGKSISGNCGWIFEHTLP
jgi:hypothetical protein